MENVAHSAGFQKHLDHQLNHLIDRIGTSVRGGIKDSDRDGGNFLGFGLLSATANIHLWFMKSYVNDFYPDTEVFKTMLEMEIIKSVPDGVCVVGGEFLRYRIPIKVEWESDSSIIVCKVIAGPSKFLE